MTDTTSSTSVGKLSLLAIVPAALACLTYEVFLGHRHDYTGHFAAGYGGSLGAMMLLLKLLPPIRFPRWSTMSIGPASMACILLGMLAEATAFRIAKFDEIDFFNQSIGAVLAGIVACRCADSPKPNDRAFDIGMIVGIAFLSVGACFAVA
jgi:hypothetical protein